MSNQYADVPSEVYRYKTSLSVLYQKSPTIAFAGGVVEDVVLTPPAIMLPVTTKVLLDV